MNAFHYIAESNPYAAKAICSSLGYKISNVHNEEDLGDCLRKIVAKEGESALKVVMEQHPDKDVILELFGNGNEYSNATGGGAGCGCSASLNACGNNQCSCNGCKNNSPVRASEQYMNFDGSKNSTSLAGMSIIAAALIFAVAIIIKKT